jgi:hypothetical protein
VFVDWRIEPHDFGRSVERRECGANDERRRN